MAGTNGYRDLACAVDVVDQAAITLSATQKALWAPARTLILAKDWTVGRTWKLTAGIKLVTDGTAGNYVFGCGVGTGDAPAVIVVGSSQAGVVSKTFMAIMEAWITCRTIGTAGTVSIYGKITPDLSGILSTALPYVFPTAGATVVSTLDMTLSTGAATFQCQRSGAGVWTATCVGVPLLEALN